MSTNQYNTEQVPVDGGNMMVGVWGPDDPAAPAILAVHGVTASHQAWGLVADALPGVRVIAPDLRGRGRSNHLPGPYGMPVHADDLARVLEHFGTGPIPVVGHSMGAFVSLVLAHRHPGQVASLLLVDGGLPLLVPEGLDDEQIVQAVLGPAAARLEMEFDSHQAYRDYWAQHPAFARHWNSLVERYVDYDLQGLAPHLRPSTNYRALAEDTAELHRGASLPAALDGLSHPVRFLQSPRGLLGVEPGLYDSGYVAQWAARIPALETHLIPDTNHYTIVMEELGANTVAGFIRAMPGLCPAGKPAPDAESGDPS
ncbi:MAG: alpha/beta hydrolase [Paeniglutamicibacter sp.]